LGAGLLHQRAEVGEQSLPPLAEFLEREVQLREPPR
jgi:hypothetical protein